MNTTFHYPAPHGLALMPERSDLAPRVVTARQLTPRWLDLIRRLWRFAPDSFNTFECAANASDDGASRLAAHDLYTCLGLE